MSDERQKASAKVHWESVHVCPTCEHVINLAEIDLKAITTGIVACPNCDWSGPIEITITDGTVHPHSEEQK
jgi:ribosomal protein L37AE/L43A